MRENSFMILASDLLYFHRYKSVLKKRFFFLLSMSYMLYLYNLFSVDNSNTNIANKLISANRVKKKQTKGIIKQFPLREKRTVTTPIHE